MAADKGQDKSKTSEDDGKNTEDKTGTGNSDPVSKTEESDDKKDQGPDKVATQADLDALAAKVRKEEKDKYDKKLLDEKAAQDRAAAEKQGNFEALYKAEQTKVVELTARAEQADKYATRINAHIDAEIKTWDADIKALDPGTDNLEARMAWVEKSRGLAVKMGAMSKAPNQEHGSGSGQRQQGQTPSSVKDVTHNQLRRKYAPPAKNKA